jgi:serine/threonine-protein kinase
MAYAHVRGVIHRDLKPSNIMVGSFGEVQVMDWGLAKVLPQGEATADEPEPEPTVPASVIHTVRSDSDADVSTAGSVLGTPGYMAPEQARGESDRVDERADVFGLGAILCEILTGEPAFVGRSPGEALRKAGRGELGDAFGRLECCGAEAELIALAKDCLAPEREDRPGRAGVVSERITAYLAGVQERLRKAELARVEAQARAEEEAKRATVERARRLLTVGLAATVLALTIVGGLSTIYYLQQRAARAAAVARVLGEARALRDQARAQPGDLARWPVALAAVQQAEGVLGGDVESRRERNALRAEVKLEADAAQRDRTLLDRLDDIRSAKADDADRSATDASYADAFRYAGLDLAALSPDEAATAIKARPPAVALALAAALDDWAAVRRDRQRSVEEWRRLVAIARAVAPDVQRDRLRTIFSETELRASLEPLRALAREADPGSWPVQSLDLLANTLAHAGDPGAAAELLHRSQVRYPGDVWINYDLGRTIRRARPTQVVEAIQAYAIARALRPETGHDLAHLLEQSGRTAEAVELFEDLARRLPSDPHHLVCLGRVHDSQGKPGAAREVFRRATAVARELVRDRPENLQAYLVLGNALHSLGDQDGAVAAYREGLRIHPGIPVLHDNLGNALSKRGDLDGALAEHREALRLDPTYANAYNNSSMVLMSRGDLDGALAAAREAVRLEPDDPTARSNLGAVLETRGDHAGAVAAFREAVRLKPDLAEAHTNLGIALENTGDIAAALAEHRLAMRLKPSDPRPSSNLSAMLGRLKDLDGAVAAAREAVRRDPNYARGYRNLGVALENKGDFEGAIKAGREAIRLRPDDAENHFNFGNALRSHGDLDGAVKAYREAIRLSPKLAMAHTGLGGALLEKKDLDGAIAAYREAIHLAPGDPDYRYNLGLALEQKGDLDAANAAFHEALRTRPDSPEFQRAVGGAELRAGRLDEAIAAYRALVRLAGDRADTHYDLANTLLISGRADKAIRSYQEALRIQPGYPEAHCNLAHAFRSQGRSAEALDHFRKGHELGSKRPSWPYPSSEWVRQAEREIALKDRLPAVIRGVEKPRDAAEGMEFAELARQMKRFGPSARLYAEAFQADPKLAGDMSSSNRYNATCAAALGGCGLGQDDPPPDEAARAQLHNQALDWLKAEHAAWAKLRESGPTQARPVIVQTLQHWRTDPDLAGLREPGALAKLPAAEQKAWRALWADVDALLQKAQGDRP